ncbi:hypothetical protein BGZ74_004994, partial [Mortierella antarctica]
GKGQFQRWRPEPRGTPRTMQSLSVEAPVVSQAPQATNTMEESPAISQAPEATNAVEESLHNNPFWSLELDNIPRESLHDSFWLSRCNNASEESLLTWISENYSAKTPTRNAQRSKYLNTAPDVPIFT